MKNKKIILIAGLTLFGFFGLTSRILAVDIFLFSANKEMTSDKLVVSFGVDTGSDKINAVAGELSYDSSRLELVSASNANSIIPLWVEAPITKDSGAVSFSGIIPGGFGGTGRIISLIFRPITGIENVTKYVRVKKIEILRNNGLGEAVETKIVIPADSLLRVLDTATTDDKTAPESFRPLLSQNDPLLGGQSYLIFNTTDKGSGIDKYFVVESAKKLNLKDKESLTKLMWQSAESPYLLQDQSLQSYIYVQAVDRAGNALVVELAKSKKFYQFWWFWFIIIISALGVCFWWRRKFL